MTDEKPRPTINMADIEAMIKKLDGLDLYKEKFDVTNDERLWGSTSDRLEEWDELTDPRTQNPNVREDLFSEHPENPKSTQGFLDFRYLVHGIMPQVCKLDQMIAVCDEMRRNPGMKPNHIDLLEEHRRINEKPTISTSLIDAQHRVTFGNAGFILKTPLENILKTCAGDCGNRFFAGEDYVAELYRERGVYGIASPSRVLSLTSPSQWNEIVLAGTGRTGQKVEIQGVFVKVLPDNSFCDDETAKRLQYLAGCNQWPIVRIQEPFTPYEDDEPDFSERHLGINRNGKRYMYNGRFSVCEFGGKKIRAMKCDERAYAFELIRQHLAQKPDEKLEAILRTAEQVPDSALLKAVCDEMDRRNRDEDGRERIRKETIDFGKLIYDDIKPYIDAVIPTTPFTLPVGKIINFNKIKPSDEKSQAEKLAQEGYIPFEAYSNLQSTRGFDVGFVPDGKNGRTFGRGAAGIIIVSKDLQEILLVKRSAYVQDPEKWGITGGARKETGRGLDDSLTTAVTETREEIGGMPKGRIRAKPYVFKKPGTSFTYETFVLEIDDAEKEKFVPRLNWENTEYKWYRRDALDGVDIHPGVREVLDNYQFEVKQGEKK